MAAESERIRDLSRDSEGMLLLCALLCSKEWMVAVSGSRQYRLNLYFLNLSTAVGLRANLDSVVAPEDYTAA